MQLLRYVAPTAYKIIIFDLLVSSTITLQSQHAIIDMTYPGSKCNYPVDPGRRHGGIGRLWPRLRGVLDGGSGRPYLIRPTHQSGAAAAGLSNAALQVAAGFTRPLRRLITALLLPVSPELAY